MLLASSVFFLGTFKVHNITFIYHENIVCVEMTIITLNITQIHKILLAFFIGHTTLAGVIVYMDRPLIIFGYYIDGFGIISVAAISGVLWILVEIIKPDDNIGEQP